MTANAAKVVFLDRDGTINVDHGYVYTRDNWEWTPGAIQALKKLHEAGYVLAVITNQSGIGHDMYTEDDMKKLHVFMQEELQKSNVPIIVTYCPHARDAGCDCRKPNIGMAKQVEEIIGTIDYEQSWTIGDKDADVGFGKKAGTRTFLIKSRYWKEDTLPQKPDFIVESLAEAADIITQHAQT